jgi:hypothetical protein
MRLPPMLQGEQRVRLIQGAVAGSVLTIAIGFGFGGWEMHTNVERRAELRVHAALVKALAPICVDNFRRAADEKASMVAFKATDAWKRDLFIEKGGWATFPGSKQPKDGVAEACAKVLNEAK